MSKIDHIIEVLFQGGTSEPIGPLSQRMKWVLPDTGKKPPKPPKAMMPTEQDFQDLEPDAPAPPDSPEEGATNIPIKDMSDKVGRHSMSDLIPKSELATIDQLLDAYFQMQKTHGPDKAKQWFDQYRTAEFESAVRKIVDILLENELSNEQNAQMPEEYYSQWEKYRRAERRAKLLAKKHAGDGRKGGAWDRASARLAGHENKFGTPGSGI